MDGVTCILPLTAVPHLYLCLRLKVRLQRDDICLGRFSVAGLPLHCHMPEYSASPDHCIPFWAPEEPCACSTGTETGPSARDPIGSFVQAQKPATERGVRLLWCPAPLRLLMGRRVLLCGSSTACIWPRPVVVASLPMVWLWHLGFREPPRLTSFVDEMPHFRLPDADQNCRRPARHDTPGTDRRSSR